MTVLHIVVAMKPMEKSFAENALELGISGINIDDCRIGTTTRINSSKAGVSRVGVNGGMSKGTETEIKDYGRFPANVMHDGSEEVTEQFPETSGESKPRVLRLLKETTGWSGGSQKTDNAGTVHCDSGSAARYFKECKK